MVDIYYGIDFINQDEKDKYSQLWNDYQNICGDRFESAIGEIVQDNVFGYVCTIFLYIARIDLIIEILNKESTIEDIQYGINMLNEMEYNTICAINEGTVLEYIGEDCHNLLEIIQLGKARLCTER